ncbi:MAG: hypothetical protein GY909_06385 [Oligoflexia bacterium]|nr:hypothetical protein [Oligoflexia bacterium]
MRSQFYNTMLEVLPRLENTIFIGSDLGAGTLDELKEKIGDRFIMEGVNESHMVTMASGLSSEGFTVFCSTITPFLLRRAYEHIYLDVGCRNSSVKLMGNGGGLVYAPLGTTHLAIEDIHLMKGIPNIRIYTPSDKQQIDAIIKFEAKTDGPCYIRMIKGKDKSYLPENYVFDPQNIDILKDLKDTNIITYGETLSIANEIYKDSKVTGLVNIPVIKPFPEKEVLKVLERSQKIFCPEVHIKEGSLYTDLIQLAQEKKIECEIIPWHLPNQKIDLYGSEREILNHFGITDFLKRNIDE